MYTVLGMNVFIVAILLFILCLYFTKGTRDEGFTSISGNTEEPFGMSPGTMDQLASTRVCRKDVNRRPDQDLVDQIQLNLTKQGLRDMTDPVSPLQSFAPA